MRNILQKFKKEDTGSAQIIEMTMIFPTVLLVMGFLIYIGCYILQGVTIYNDAQKVAVLAAREVAMPGYCDNMCRGSNGSFQISSKADFDWADGDVPGKGIINAIMGNKKPYIYMSPNLLGDSENELEKALKNLIQNNSFLVPSNVDCDIAATNNLLSQSIQVKVTNSLTTPSFVQYLGLPSSVDLNITATAVVGDSAEFIRNTNIVFDLKDFLFDKIKIGGETINEKISIIKQKFGDAKAKFGLGE